MLSHLIKIPAALAICLLAPPTLAAPTIWTGPSISFAKAGFADWTLPENQDRITDTVWITRGNNQSLFNAQQESSYSSPSPSGTAWAMGTTDELSSLTFGTWVSVFGGGALPGGPTAAVGQDFVLHLTAEDIYIDLRVDAWGSGSAAGGGFAYTRSTAAVPEPAAIGLSLAAVGAASCRRRRR